MADFKFYIDTIEVKEPIGWELLETGYVRILDTRSAMIPRPEGELVFFEDGYDLLQNLWDKGGTCGQSLFKIEFRCNEFDAYATLFEGFIRAVDIEYDLENCLAKVAQVIDNNYISYLNVNGNIKAYPSVARSKDDSAITAVTPINIDYFNPQSVLATYTFTNRPSYLVYDVFEFLVAFCSDGNLTFDSTFFGPGGEGEGIFIITGEGLRTGNDISPNVSWDQMLIEMYRLYNVVPMIDDSGATPEIRVEKADDTYDAVVGTTFQSTAIKGLKRRSIPFGVGNVPYNGSIPVSVFTNYKIGSATTLDDSGGWSYPDVRWINFKEEEYHTLGDCGFKQEFSIVNDFVIDSNVFEDCLVTPNSAYDSKIFVVETDYPTNARATKFDIFTPGAVPYTYNDGLTNSSRSARFVGAVPSSIAAYLGNGNDGFRAEDTSLPITINVVATNIDPFPFDDDCNAPNNDPNNNYDGSVLCGGTALYRYTAPANGLYAFQVDLSFVNVVPVPVTGPSWDFNILVRRYNAGGTLIETKTYTETNRSTAGNVTYTPTAFYLDNTDYVDVRYEHSANGAGPFISYDIDEAIFRTTAVQTGGGIYQTVDFGTFRGAHYLFQIPMTFDEFNALVAYPDRYDAVFINFGDTTKDITGWIVQAQYKIGKDGGLATIELVSTS